MKKDYNMQKWNRLVSHHPITPLPTPKEYLVDIFKYDTSNKKYAYSMFLSSKIRLKGVYI